MNFDCLSKIPEDAQWLINYNFGTNKTVNPIDQKLMQFRAIRLAGAFGCMMTACQIASDVFNNQINFFRLIVWAGLGLASRDLTIIGTNALEPKADAFQGTVQFTAQQSLLSGAKAGFTAILQGKKVSEAIETATNTVLEKVTAEEFAAMINKNITQGTVFEPLWKNAIDYFKLNEL